MSDLVAAGFTNCVLPICKMEMALRKTMLQEEPVPKGFTLELLVGQVAEHIRLCFNMLRLMHVEDGSGISSEGRFRRYPKTGGFRRQLSAADTVLVQSLVRQVKLRAPRAADACEPEDQQEETNAHEQAEAGTPQTEAETPPLSVEESMALFRRGMAMTGEEFPESMEGQEFTWGQATKIGQVAKVDDAESAIDLVSSDEEEQPVPSVADTLEYDEFGCLMSQGAESILPPNSKKRRLAVLNRRKHTKQPKSPASTPTKEGKKAKTGKLAKAEEDLETTPAAKKTKETAAASSKKVSKTRLPQDIVAALPLSRCTMSGPTAELPPRVELCAKGQLDGKTIRVYVYTTTETKWGPSFVSDMKRVVEAIESKGLTKLEALSLRDELLAKAKASK